MKAAPLSKKQEKSLCLLIVRLGMNADRVSALGNAFQNFFAGGDLPSHNKEGSAYAFFFEY